MEVHLPTLFFRQQSLIGSTMNNFAEFERATTAVGSGQVPVIIDRTFPFEDVPEALLYLEQSQQFGKVAITIASGGTS